MKTDAIKEVIKQAEATPYFFGSPRLCAVLAEAEIELGTLAALEADNAAMREALNPCCGYRDSEGYDPDLCSARCASAWRCKALALTPDSGKVQP